MKPKNKRGASWTQGARNQKLIGQAKAAKLEITETLEEMKKIKEKSLRGFNSVESCPNCNKPIIKDQSPEINRHEFSNPYEFTDKALLEELIIRLKKGCIEIKETKKGLIFEEECRWDLARKGENYSISLSELRDIQEKWRKLEDERKLCNSCLEREMNKKEIFCKLCWEREIKKQKNMFKKR
ncbi:MAG: hypothetical protein I3274_02655 [Candidatus Moeniiplasma glomeromycotorum]|nr:hypothetical protein [Candidatus Moeniiplasma glomeromycotorum]MCE8167505.1 hypothetical protein [Candidatus Moeniiplasma glomeromycotorum]